MNSSCTHYRILSIQVSHNFYQNFWDPEWFPNKMISSWTHWLYSKQNIRRPQHLQFELKKKTQAIHIFRAWMLTANLGSQKRKSFIFIYPRHLYEFFLLWPLISGDLAKEKRPSRGINQHGWSTKSNQRNSEMILQYPCFVILEHIYQMLMLMRANDYAHLRIFHSECLSYILDNFIMFLSVCFGIYFTQNVCHIFSIIS